MTHLGRVAGLFFLLALIPFSSAQEENTIRVVGSAIVKPLFDALISSSQSPIQTTADISGTSAGFVAFCSGQADVVLATRPINSDEDASCISQGVSYSELLLGTYNVALVSSSSLDFVTCLSLDELTRLLGPSASGVVNNWLDVNTEFPDEPITVFLPPIDTLAYTVLDQQLSGDGLRSDAVFVADNNDIVQQIVDSAGAIGFLSYETALSQSDILQIIDVSLDSDNCVTPSAENTEADLYPFGNRLLIYVNDTIRLNPDVEAFLNFIAGDSATQTIITAGFTPPSLSAASINQAVLSGERDRILTQESVAYEIPADVSGPVVIGGGALAEGYIRSVLNSFISAYPSVTLDLRFDGVVSGLRRLCNGELDASVTYGELSAEQQANCASNDITTRLLPLSAQAVVLVANAEDGFAACLTTNHVYTIWRAESDGVVELWSEVDPAFPELKMTLFGLLESSGSVENDLLFTGFDGVIPPIRLDIEHNLDPLYRAAATANVQGALTYMFWDDYERVLANNQQNIQLVAINGGSGCVEPNEQTIRDGLYPLSRHLFLAINENQLALPSVQSALWYLYDDVNIGRLESFGFLLFDADELLNVRSELLSAYELAEQSVVEVTPEATEMAPDAESTSEPGQ